MSDVVDMTLGRYRRVYENARTGRRINAISPEAEMVFWRVHNCVADDFGNFLADPRVLMGDAVPRRDYTVERFAELLRECVDVKLIGLYQAANETYGHIHGFLLRQPAARNGKRCRKHPESPFERDELQGKPVEPDAPEGPQVNPGESERPQGKPHESNRAVTVMRDHGINDDTIAWALRDHGAEKAMKACDRLDQYRKRKLIDNPGAFFRTLLEKGFTEPKPTKPKEIKSTRHLESAADDAALERIRRERTAL